MFILSLLLMLADVIDLQNTNAFDVPPEYQNEAVVVVHTVDTQGEMNFVCGPAPKGYYKVACAKGNYIYIRNPCLDPEEKDRKSYAHTFCHEIAHTEGWHHINE